MYSPFRIWFASSIVPEKKQKFYISCFQWKLWTNFPKLSMGKQFEKHLQKLWGILWKTVACVCSSCELTCIQIRPVGKSWKNISNPIVCPQAHVGHIIFSLCVSNVSFPDFLFFCIFNCQRSYKYVHAAGSRCGHFKMSTVKTCIWKTYLTQSYFPH